MISALLLLPIISVIAIYLVRMKEVGTKRKIVAGPVKENWTLRLFVATGLLMLASILVEYFWRKLSLWWPTFLAGWGLALTSFVIRRKAIAALGRFWSLHVEIRENHEFVRSGPFRWVRHPTYLSMILELLAGPLITNSFYSLAILPLIFVPALIWRMHLEEAALLEQFGDAYRKYQRTTPALFPYKWPRPA